MRGVACVALGSRAVKESKESFKTLAEHTELETYRFEDVVQSSKLTVVQQAHLAKTKAYTWSPFEHTLLLDADTRVLGDISYGFDLLSKGWEVVMVPSKPPTKTSVLWHLGVEERNDTLDSLGHMAHVMLNTGVIFFRRSNAVQDLFRAWEDEWYKFEKEDQGAFLRALNHSPVKLWLLGYKYNSTNGKLIDHRFGAAV